MHPFDLIIKHATLPHGVMANVGIRDGKIAEIAMQSDPLGTATAELDIQGNLLCPGFIDGHIHLDKTFLGAGWQPHITGGSIRERIAAEKRAIASLTVPVKQRAAELIKLAVSRGTTQVRTHVDIDPEVGLANLEAILELRDEYRDWLSIQIVAFPQSGVLSCPGTAELLAAAIATGADLVGGLDPASIDGDVAGQLDTIFAIADRQSVGIDIHLHDPDQLGIFQLEQIAARTVAYGLKGYVTVSHAYCLGMVPDEVLCRTAEQLAAAEVSIMTNAPGSHAFPPIARLRSLGVNVFSGSDNIRDAWWPFGDADMLERAMLVAYCSDFRTDADLTVAFELATSAGAIALNLPCYGLQPGAPADLVILPVHSVPEAIVTRPPRKWVIKAGQPIVHEGWIIE